MAQDEDLKILGAIAAGQEADSWMERHSVRSVSRGSTRVASAVGAAEAVR
jgi:hypothetical protein